MLDERFLDRVQVERVAPLHAVAGERLLLAGHLAELDNFEPFEEVLRHLGQPSPNLVRRQHVAVAFARFLDDNPIRRRAPVARTNPRAGRMVRTRVYLRTCRPGGPASAADCWRGHEWTYCDPWPGGGPQIDLTVWTCRAFIAVRANVRGFCRIGVATTLEVAGLPSKHRRALASSPPLPSGGNWGKGSRPFRMPLFHPRQWKRGCSKNYLSSNDIRT